MQHLEPQIIIASISPNYYMKSHLNGKKLSSKQAKRRKNTKTENETKNDVFESIIEAEDGSFLCDQCPFIGSKEDLTWHVKQIHKDRYEKIQRAVHIKVA